MEKEQTKDTNNSWTPNNPPVVDPFLWAMVRQADNEDASLPVLINIGGAIVSGELIGEKQCFFLTSTQFAENASFANESVNADDEIRQTFREAILSHSLSQMPSVDDIDAHYFIHLKNVTIHLGTEKFQAPIWRGHLSAVVGHIFGTDS